MLYQCCFMHLFMYLFKNVNIYSFISNHDFYNYITMNVIQFYHRFILIFYENLFMYKWYYLADLNKHTCAIRGNWIYFG